MNLAHWLLRAAQQEGNRPALLQGTSVRETYLGFAERAAALGKSLASRGIGPGDRVSIYLPNHPDYLVGLFAIWWIGAVAVPINAKLHPREVAWIVDHSGSKIVFTTPEYREGLAEALAENGRATVLDQLDAGRCPLGQPTSRGQDDLAWLFYTSGTTGTPKGAMLSHGNLVAMSLSYLADVDDVMPEDCALYAAPMSHGAGLYSLVHVLRAARHCVPESGGFSGEEVLDLAWKLDRVSLFAAPTMVRRLTDAGRRQAEPGTGLRTVVYGGGPMYQADLTDAMEVFGPRFVQIYGQGETPMTISVLSRVDHGTAQDPGPHRATVGRAHSVMDIRIIVEGRELPLDEPGEIEVRGPTVMLGYWNDAAATARALRSGWLATGDIGWMNADGYLTLTDRSKDVIISGGSNIYPREVEEVLLTHPAIHEVSIIGVPDAEWGEVVVAVIVSDSNDDGLSAELDELCCQRIARFKRPKRYVRMLDLPKNNYGKVLKTELRARLT